MMMVGKASRSKHPRFQRTVELSQQSLDCVLGQERNVCCRAWRDCLVSKSLPHPCQGKKIKNRNVCCIKATVVLDILLHTGKYNPKKHNSFQRQGGRQKVGHKGFLRHTSHVSNVHQSMCLVVASVDKQVPFLSLQDVVRYGSAMKTRERYYSI